MYLCQSFTIALLAPGEESGGVSGFRLDGLSGGIARSSVSNSSYELIFLKIRVKYEHFLNKNTSKIRVKYEQKYE